MNYSPSGVRRYMEDRHGLEDCLVDGPPDCPICRNWHIGLDNRGNVNWCEDCGEITYNDEGEPECHLD